MQLRKMVDYPAVDAKVKAYDRESFQAVRGDEGQGQYEKMMSPDFQRLGQRGTWKPATLDGGRRSPYRPLAYWQMSGSGQARPQSGNPF